MHSGDTMHVMAGYMVMIALPCLWLSLGSS
ncbi:hypothetical protein NC651_009385 [Populus alba x Populus x berolinensis]|nr:hypothetical protein NC651_009385 [Populus alba x Populus x berolinensis]